MKYLPIGTVLILKEAEKKIMITGYCVSSEDKKIYDYSGCLFPEGIVSLDKIILFNHSEINKVYYLGYHDDEQKKFVQKLEDTIKNINNLK